jgi:hypothetical protein
MSVRTARYAETPGHTSEHRHADAVNQTRAKEHDGQVLWHLTLRRHFLTSQFKCNEDEPKKVTPLDELVKSQWHAPNAVKLCQRHKCRLPNTHVMTSLMIESHEQLNTWQLWRNIPSGKQKQDGSVHMHLTQHTPSHALQFNATQTHQLWPLIIHHTILT